MPSTARLWSLMVSGSSCGRQRARTCRPSCRAPTPASRASSPMPWVARRCSAPSRPCGWSLTPSAPYALMRQLETAQSCGVEFLVATHSTRPACQSWCSCRTAAVAPSAGSTSRAVAAAVQEGLEPPTGHSRERVWSRRLPARARPGRRRGPAPGTEAVPAVARGPWPRRSQQPSQRLEGPWATPGSWSKVPGLRRASSSHCQGLV
mmetsp:Transcript_34426/g.109308  ORF Transcript_34426/g.109308 Transcript_34426/m.109308 type:complete len:206 (-) Transcript_34426:89-706(-)